MSLFRICYFLKKIKKNCLWWWAFEMCLFGEFLAFLYRWASPPYAMGVKSGHNLSGFVIDFLGSMGDTMIEIILVIIALFNSAVVTKTLGIVGIAAICAMNTVTNEPKKATKAIYRMRVLDYLNGLTNIMAIHGSKWTKYSTMKVGVEWAKYELIVCKALLVGYKAHAKLNNWTLAIDVGTTNTSSPIYKLNDMIVILTDMALTQTQKDAMKVKALKASIAMQQKQLDAMAKGKGGKGKKE